MASIRCLHVVPSLDRAQGGLATAALGVCQQLALEGHSVEIVTSHSPDDSIEHVAAEYPDVKIHYLPRTFPARFSNCSAIGGWIEANRARFDIIEIHGVFFFILLRAAAAAQRIGVPYLLRPHGSLDPFDLRKKKLIKKLMGPWLIRGLIERSTGVVCTSALEAELLETYGARAARHVVPLPVPAMPQASAAAAAEFRKKHGIPEDAFVVLFLSRIDYKKGLQYLIPALASLKKDYPKLWLVMAGGGQPAFVESIRTEIAACGMSGWTTFPGFLSGMEKMAGFGAANLFALPSQNENFGIVVVEALQCGLPSLISTGVYIHREIEASGGALVCEPSLDSCREGLRRLLADEGLRLRLREQSVRTARTVYSPEAANRGLIGLYSGALKSLRTPAGESPLGSNG